MDYEMAAKTGVKFNFGAAAEFDIKKLKENYDFIIIATGAWSEGACPVKEGGGKLLDALRFLEQSKSCGCHIDLGGRVAVIGGGDVAMDSARAAARAPGVEKVSIIYRRTKEFMPAEKEELDLALADGVEFMELLAPLSYDGKFLTVEHMELGEKDRDGRRKFISTGKTEKLPFDTVISAVGSRVDASVFIRNNIKMEDDRYAELGQNNRTSMEGVYVAGDCRRGPATIVRAAADSKMITLDILNKLGLSNDFVRVSLPADAGKITARRAVLCECGGSSDPERCLNCGSVCEICCEVCPNRANVSIHVNGKPQILHIDGMCNECGNCGVFCPHTGDPYRGKITLFWDMESFWDSSNKGFLFQDRNTVLVRNESGDEFECGMDDKRLSPELAAMIRTVRDDCGYLIP